MSRVVANKQGKVIMLKYGGAVNACSCLGAFLIHNYTRTTDMIANPGRLHYPGRLHF
jgi:hypothetical protein